MKSFPCDIIGCKKKAYVIIDDRGVVTALCNDHLSEHKAFDDKNSNIIIIDDAAAGMRSEREIHIRYQIPQRQPKETVFWEEAIRSETQGVSSPTTLPAQNPDKIFSVYECPHCGKYHVGTVRK